MRRFQIETGLRWTGRIRELRQVISSDRAVLLDMMVYRNQGWVAQVDASAICGQQLQKRYE